MRSAILDTRGEGLQIILSFIVAMFETAMTGTPTSTPTKPGGVQDKEVQAFEDEIWSKIYKQIDECKVDDDDGEYDMTDVFPLGGF